MNKTNCPNCGAPIDIHAEKCAYCDTPYIDHDSVENRIESLRKEHEEIKLQIDQERIYASLINIMANFGVSAVQAANGLCKLRI